MLRSVEWTLVWEEEFENGWHTKPQTTPDGRRQAGGTLQESKESERFAAISTRLRSVAGSKIEGWRPYGVIREVVSQSVLNTKVA